MILVSFLKRFKIVVYKVVSLFLKIIGSLVNKIFFVFKLGKILEEIRKIFNIKNDFIFEEEE